MRSLLEEFERSERETLLFTRTTTSSADDLERLHHVRLLSDAGLALQLSESAFRITNEGHDFLDNARVPGSWQKAKDSVAEHGGSIALSLFADILRAYVRKKLEDSTGLEL